MILESNSSKAVEQWCRSYDIEIKSPSRFKQKVNTYLDVYQQALKSGLTPKPHFFEALAYHERASLLQDMNLNKRPRTSCGDPLQDHIPIYDTVQRRYAGFSNVLEQLWHGEHAPKLKKNEEMGFNYLVDRKVVTTEAWLALFLAHRVTGSGASFEHDHGWRNTAVPTAALIAAGYDGATKQLKAISKYMGTEHQGPLFTSIGNQIPPFSKKVNLKYLTAGQEYLAETLSKVATKTLKIFEKQKHALIGIKGGTEMALAVQRELGHKQFKFVFTAWVMDIAEYFPTLVDPRSDVFHGKNAMETQELIFDTSKFKGTRQQLYDTGTRFIADWSGTRPMDVEDAAGGCDFVRYVENYVPRKGFDHVHDKGIFNSSSLHWHKGRQP